MIYIQIQFKSFLYYMFLLLYMQCSLNNNALMWMFIGFFLHCRPLAMGNKQTFVIQKYLIHYQIWFFRHTIGMMIPSLSISRWGVLFDGFTEKILIFWNALTLNSIFNKNNRDYTWFDILKSGDRNCFIVSEYSLIIQQSI